MSFARRSKVAAALLALLGLGGCDPRDCLLGIANRDCAPVGSPTAMFPQDDAVCRSYHLKPGTADYAICREQKLHVRSLTERATDFGVLQNPIVPDVRPVLQAR